MCQVNELKRINITNGMALTKLESFSLCCSLKGGSHMKDITPKQNDSPLEYILQLMENMQYGSITLIIQDGKVIQIDKIEKYRIK